MKLDHATVLVTGANRGLGRSLVAAALAAGARRIYATARDPRSLAPVVATAPDRITPLALDVTDPRAVEATAKAAPDVTLLINNAGVLASYRVLESGADDIARDFATNVFGLLAVTRAFVPALERAAAAGGAAIVNVLSVASLASVPALGAYSASKAAAFSVTQGLRSALAARRIAVHAAFPGAIDTDMIRAMAGPKTSPDAVAAAILADVAQGVEDIAPDPMSRELFAMWQRDPRALERQFATAMA